MPRPREGGRWVGDSRGPCSDMPEKTWKPQMMRRRVKTRFMRATLMALCCAMTLSCAAQSGTRTSGMVGKPSPAFVADRSVNEPADKMKTLAGCKGEVVLVKLWGVKCAPCLASMPEVQALWTKYEGKGLHVFMLERQGHDEAAITKVFRSRGLTFPGVLEGSFPFQGAGTLPYAYVIGVDGPVIFEGHSGYWAVIDEEIQKVK